MTDKELLEAFGQDVYVSCPKDFALNSIVLPGEFKLRRYDSKQQYQAETVIGLPTLMILIIDEAIHSIGKGSYEELLYAEKHNVPVIAWFKDLASIEDWCYTSKDVTTRDIINNGNNWNRYCQLGANNKDSLISKLKTLPVPTPRVGGDQWYHYTDDNMCYNCIFKMHSESLYTERVRCKDSNHRKDRGYLSKKQVGAKCTEEELLKFLPKDHPDRPTVPVPIKEEAIKLEEFPTEGYCKTGWDDLIRYLESTGRRSSLTFPRESSKILCWNKDDYYYMILSSKTEYDYKQLFPFIVKSNLDKHRTEQIEKIIKQREAHSVYGVVDHLTLHTLYPLTPGQSVFDVASLEARLEELRRRYYY